MRRRTRFLGTITLLGALGALAPSPGGAVPADGVVDPATAAAAVERQVGDRYGGYWVERDGDDEVVHVNVVEPTADDRALAGDGVRIDEATHSYDELVAARDAVASALDRERTGDYAVGVDVPDNGLTLETERGDPAVTRLLALAALQRERAAVAPTSDPGSGIGLERLNVLTGSDIGVVPLGASPTDFPPYEAGLHLRVAAGGGPIIRCTSGFAFAGPLATYGSTAGHCGGRGATVRVDDTVVGQVAINAFEAASPVRADTALYPLPAGADDGVIHGNPTHRRVTGSLSDHQIGAGMRLCFDGRASGIGNCGTVDAVGRLVCCDAQGRSFVFTCVDQPAQAGDSGGPVYQAIGPDRAVAAGTLSSSVRLDGRRSMCFSTIDQIEQETGTAVVAG